MRSTTPRPGRRSTDDDKNLPHNNTHTHRHAAPGHTWSRDPPGPETLLDQRPSWIRDPPGSETLQDQKPSRTRDPPGLKLDPDLHPDGEHLWDVLNRSALERLTSTGSPSKTFRAPAESPATRF